MRIRFRQKIRVSVIIEGGTPKRSPTSIIADSRRCTGASMNSNASSASKARRAASGQDRVIICSTWPLLRWVVRG